METQAQYSERCEKLRTQLHEAHTLLMAAGVRGISSRQRAKIDMARVLVEWAYEDVDPDEKALEI